MVQQTMRFSESNSRVLQYFCVCQLVKMFAVVVWIFMVCWAPYHIYFIYSYHNPKITRISYISHVYLAFYWLAMATTCVNPIIYYWMNKRFRAYFNMIFFFLPRYVSRAASTRWSMEAGLALCSSNRYFSFPTPGREEKLRIIPSEKATFPSNHLKISPKPPLGAQLKL